MIRFPLPAVCGTLTAGAVAFLWLTEIPLGIPGEWTWERIRVDEAERLDALLGALQAGLALLGYAAFCWAGALRLIKAGRAETAAWLAGLAAAGFGWLWIVQQSPPAEHRLQKTAFVLYFPGSSGYFFEARYGIDEVGTFLADYEEWMSERDVLHIGTHPPGLFLFHRGLIRLCESSPRLTDLLLATQPRGVEEAWAVIAENAHNTGFAFGADDRAALWLAALLTQLIAAATVVPLYLVLRRSHSRSASWMAASLWPLVPAVAVFLPKSDALYPFLGMLALWASLQGGSRSSAVGAFCAGLLFWLGLFFSLAFLPVGLLAVLLCAWEWQAPDSVTSHAGAQGGNDGGRLSRRRDRETEGQRDGETAGRGDRAVTPSPSLSVSRSPQWKRPLKIIAWAVVGFLLPVFLLWVVWDVNLFNVWSWNYRNHADFYNRADFPRTYWKWLLVNPVELAFAVGIPVVCLVVAAYGRMVRQPGHWRRRAWGPFWCCAAVWGLLWLSGKNMGEAARLWLFLTPWCLWLSAGAWDPPSPPPTAFPAAPRLRIWGGVLLLQAILATATVMRVNGFPLPFPGP